MYSRSPMDCRAFRQHHGSWVDDILDPSDANRLARHVDECATCARFDSLARRALLVARNAPQIEVSAEFSGRLAARIDEERRQRISEYRPSYVERRVSMRRRPGLMRVAAGIAILTGGSVFTHGAVPRDGVPSASTAGLASFDGLSMFGVSSSGAATGSGEIVVVRASRPVGGALLPLSDDPLLDGADLAEMGERNATSVAATAPLWPTAHMAAHAANRFAAMEFGDVRTVTVSQSR